MAWQERFDRLCHRSDLAFANRTFNEVSEVEE